MGKWTSAIVNIQRTTETTTTALYCIALNLRWSQYDLGSTTMSSLTWTRALHALCRTVCRWPGVLCAHPRLTTSRRWLARTAAVAWRRLTIRHRHPDDKIHRALHLIDGLVQDYSNYSMLTMDLLQSWGKPSLLSSNQKHEPLALG